MMKAVIFDLNGVFIQSPKLSDRFKDDFHVPEEDFLVVLKDIMRKVRLPDAGDSFEYWKPHLLTWGVSMDRESFFDYWFREEKEVPELIALARILRAQGVRVFVLSNNFSERIAYYRSRFPFLTNDVDKVYFSPETGFVKPDERAYERILEANNLRARECLYFDDSGENVRVASSLGIASYRYTGIDDVKEILHEHGARDL